MNLTVLSVFGIVFMILFLKQVGEWIGYRWALRHDKNVVGVAVMRRRGSNSEENHSNGDNDHGDGEMNRMPMDQVVISEVELSAIDRIIARQSTGRNPAQTQRPSPYPRQLFSTISYPVGSDLPPAYDDALHFELRDMNNVEPIDHLVGEPDCPPPSYWNSIGGNTGYR
ncbi:uncharacterized protein LOC110852430 isoform X3 [Folsomia candida]|uniref:uncharacterized protein LOC110852430 isoform X3 n=1 Tax=Folsomia candida TaxID=158441 RepID=UPI000B908F65|nr:uncharacterized protein LOC110852430 isoform X3 [Folsomia candida]